jgi:glucose/mannose-6-phosphate isomerase
MSAPAASSASGPAGALPLDDPHRLAAGDPRGFGALIRSFPAHLAEGARLAAGVRLAEPPRDGLVVVGMGGSAVAGDLLQALWRDRAPFPVEVVRGYGLPAWVGPGTAVVASSYSGSTEETLAAFAEARRRGSRPLVVTSGGPLATAAADLPLVRIPEGLPPRAALGYLLGPVLRVMGAACPALDAGAELPEALEVLAALGAELAPERPLAANAAKELATWLDGRTPAVYGTDTTAPAAYRWGTQFEENAKVLAVSGALPEMNHNAIEAWGAGPAGAWAVVLLRDGAEHPRVARRADLTLRVAGARVPAREVWARGHGRLGRLLSLVLIGDWTTYYAAILRGVDPYAVDTLDAFKRRMGPARPAGEGPRA